MDEIATLIEPHIPALRRYAWALLRNDERADDLVQDCLERAISRWPLRRRDGDLRAWLFAILRNRFLSGRRQDARRGLHVPVEEVADLAEPHAAADRGAMLRDVLAGLDTLPEDQRSLLLLVAVEDLSYEDAARVTGVPVGTVMSRLSRGRARLRAFVESGPPARLRSVT